MLSAAMVHRFSSGRVRTRKDASKIEAFLAPIKYALFSMLGYATLRQTGHIDDPAASVWTCAQCGLTGGVVLAILTLMRPPAMADRDDQISSNMLHDQLTVAVKEVISSAVAACTGGLTVRVARRYIAQVTVVGATGALISIVLLYATLGVALGVLWVVLKYCGPRTQH